MVNQPEKDTRGVQTPARRLVLPARPDEGPLRQRSSRTYTTPTGQPPAPGTQSLFTRLLRLWRKDPAYAVLSLAIALVALASLVLVALGANALLGNNGGPAWSSTLIEHPPALTPVGTVDDNPSFPTPGSNKGSSSSSQPHGGPPPVLQPGPGGPDQGALSVQIVSIPDVARNNTRVRVLVQTTEPGVSVRLQVNYDAAPFLSVTSARTTDGNGTAAITWNVRVFGFNGSGVQATVVAIATDGNGQQATSQPVTVIITG